MNRTRPLGGALLLAGALLCLHAARLLAPAHAQKSDAAAPVADTQIGLSQSSVFDAPAPPELPSNTTGPGENPPLPRAYPGEPPRIPHSIEDFEPITRTLHMCLECHQLGAAQGEGDPSPLPAFHGADPRGAPAAAGQKVDGAYYACLACHVPQSGAQPLVGNRFDPR